MLLLIISFWVIAVYTAAVCIKAKGVPYSISATYYAIEHKGWFRFTMWACPMVLMPVILEVSKPDYKADKFQYRGHIAGATMAILFSQIWAALNLWPMLLAWLLYVGYTALSIAKEKEGTFWYRFYRSKPMFWVEIDSFLVIYLVCCILEI